MRGRRPVGLAPTPQFLGSVLGWHNWRLRLSQSVRHLLVQIQVRLQKRRRSQRQPLIQRQVGIVAALEHLQEPQRCRASILLLVAHGVRNIAHVSGLKIERSRLTGRREDPHAGLTAEVILPLVGVGMPVELPQSTRFNFHKGGRDVRGGS
jgi:hypothetical protein